MAPIGNKAESKPPSRRVTRAMEPLDNVTVKVTKKEAATEIKTLTKKRRGTSGKEAATEMETSRKRRRVAADVELLGDVTVKGTKKEATSEVKTLTKRRRGTSGKEAATEIETPRKSRRVAAHVELLGNVTVTGAKKEAASEVKTLTKRRRGTIGKEAATEMETPRKRRRVAAHVELLGDVTVKGVKKEAASEVKTLTKRQKGAGGKEAATEIETPYKEQSDGKYGEFIMLKGHTSIDHFKATYMRQHVIGKGGFGLIYAGTRRSDELPVAIKYVRASAIKEILLTCNGTQSWYPLEVILMLMATEPVGRFPAVSLLDWYRLGKEVVMVMERPVPYVTLRKFAKRTGPMNHLMAKVIMKQLVNTAIHLQASKVFHGNLNLGNILIESDLVGVRVRAINFDYGCYLEDKPYTSVIGSPDYLPPEFSICQEYMGRRATVWQLGAILLQMLTGNRRFTTSSFLRKDIEISPKWSLDCQDLLNKLLAVDPRGRPNLYQIRQHPWLN